MERVYLAPVGPTVINAADGVLREFRYTAEEDLTRIGEDPDITEVLHHYMNELAPTQLQAMATMDRTMHVKFMLSINDAMRWFSITARPYGDLFAAHMRADVVNAMMITIEEVVASNDEACIDENFALTLDTWPPPRGGGGRGGGCKDKMNVKSVPQHMWSSSLEDGKCLLACLHVACGICMVPNFSTKEKTSEVRNGKRTSFGDRMFYELKHLAHPDVREAWSPWWADADNVVPLFQTRFQMRVQIDTVVDGTRQKPVVYPRADGLAAHGRKMVLLLTKNTRDATSHFSLYKKLGSYTVQEDVDKFLSATSDRNRSKRVGGAAQHVRRMADGNCISCGRTECDLRRKYGECGECGMPRCGDPRCPEDHESRCGHFLCRACDRLFDDADDLHFHESCAKRVCDECGAEHPARLKKDGTPSKQVVAHDCVVRRVKPKPWIAGIGAIDCETRECDHEKRRHVDVTWCMAYVRFNSACVAEVNALIEAEERVEDVGAAIQALRHLAPNLDQEGHGQEVVELTFTGEEQILDMVTRMAAGEWKDIVFFAHNGAAFDAQFIMCRLLRDVNMDVSNLKILPSGHKFKEVCIQRPPTDDEIEEYHDAREARGEDRVGKPPPVRLFLLRDSLSHIQGQLKGFKKMFDIAVGKGDAPFNLINRLDGAWEDYESDGFPPLEDFKRPDKEWHAAQSAIYAALGVTFKLKEFVEEYCMQDVRVLLRGTLRYMASIAELHLMYFRRWFCNFSYVTGASATSASMKLMVWNDKRIPHSPVLDDRASSSNLAREWLPVEEERLGHALDGITSTGNVIALGVGYYVHAIDRTTAPETVYLVHTCAYAGCRECFPDTRRGTEGEEEDPDAEDDDGATFARGKNYVNRAETDSDRKDRRRSTNKSTKHFSMNEAEIELNNEVRRLGKTYNVVVKLGHEIQEEMVARRSLNRERVAAGEVDVFPKIGRDVYLQMRVRDAYTGGTVDAPALFLECYGDQIIRCDDVVSLYPYAMTMELPIGVPKKYTYRGASAETRAYMDNIVANQRFGDDARGFAMVTVLPSNTRLTMLLQIKYGKCKAYDSKHRGSQEHSQFTKLIAPACHACGGREVPETCVHEDGTEHKPACVACIMTAMGEECHHGDEERAMTSTWTTAELNVAMAHGDRVLAIHHMEVFAEWEPHCRDWVAQQYKAKYMASAWEQDDHEGEYADDDARFEALFGQPMECDASFKELNEGLRLCAKLFMNAAYGKMVEKEFKRESAFVNDMDDIDRLTRKGVRTVSGVTLIERGLRDDGEMDGVAHMSVDNTNTDVSISRKTSVYCGAYVTAYGRIELFKHRIGLGGKQLYSDTDSVISVTTRAELAAAKKGGGMLGDLGEEKDKRSVAFASLGPKTYALTLEVPYRGAKEIVKAKGIKNESAKTAFSVEKFGDILTGKVRSLKAKQTQFMSTHAEKGPQVFIIDDYVRTVRLTFAKRRVLPPLYDKCDGQLRAILCVPFGYKGPHPISDTGMAHRVCPFEELSDSVRSELGGHDAVLEPAPVA